MDSQGSVSPWLAAFSKARDKERFPGLWCAVHEVNASRPQAIPQPANGRGELPECRPMGSIPAERLAQVPIPAASLSRWLPIPSGAKVRRPLLGIRLPDVLHRVDRGPRPLLRHANAMPPGAPLYPRSSLSGQIATLRPLNDAVIERLRPSSRRLRNRPAATLSQPGG